ncbi:MBL fold metallo-hydrolase [Marinobacter zhejiangensis]|uniref:Glyoxylase, beta-lactamase superfamily II n=1 Tax=Marinobacter zhejiangensis TaxID=488535 RepID=A0A1I4LGP9_9GAMM|nr:MBL fold metallo-hydrolase [Marinobacter zhejiangensis]SFL90195.1 Glyoxylase, beta-lactamase superfamily II [Marinobacter zhejiangensis]
MKIRPAATIALTRNSTNGLEVLLLQRTWKAAFMPGFYVFPGGAVDAGDRACLDHLQGTDDQAVSQTMSLDEGGADYMIAAIRECFEEAGLLLATQDGKPVSASLLATLANQRQALDQGTLTLDQLCRQHGLTLPLDRLGYLSHWITPEGAPRRFDTRFFIATAPDGQQASHDGNETIDHVWLTPQQALDDHQNGRRLIGPPTLRTLRQLRDFASSEAALAYAHANPPPVVPTAPWPARKGGKAIVLESGSPAYGEVVKLDPGQDGQALAEIVATQPVTLAPGLIRLTANNAGLMTGPGTNSYVLGQPGDYTIIDPGPADEAHLEQLLQLTDGQIRQILVTHTHRDHSPAAMALKQRTGATLVGLPAPTDASQDHSFVPDLAPEHGSVIATAAGDLRVLHTPGHASNHLCFLLGGEQILFSGDHIMQGSTVVINPPDGDMSAYLKSLQALLLEDIHYIAPGHGFLMTNPHQVVDYLTTHRLAREHKVVRALTQQGPASAKELTPFAYDDVPAALHPLATRSLLAHLEKLRTDGKARQDGQHWLWSSGDGR